jgi:chaperonin cofactor prefoldin
MQEIESVQGDARRTQLYQGLLSKVETRIPEAEKELREFHTFFEKQVEELKFLKEETNAYKAAAMISDNGSETAFEKRKESIKALEGNLKKHAKRAESLLEVQDLVKTF